MLILGAIVVFIYMTTWFVIAVVAKDNGLADIAWGLGFAVLAIVGWMHGANNHLFFVLLGMVLLWALRLAAYLYYRNRVRKTEDFRYRSWREDWGDNWIWVTFWRVFMLQGFFMWVIALPIMLCADQLSATLNPWGIIGLALFLFGWLFETIADQQMLLFKSKEEHKGKIITSGLWKYSRHPNYFGESLCWWGIFCFTLQFEHSIWGIASPLVLTWLLTSVSGVPLLEKRYRDNLEFQDYARRTSVFFPWPPRK
jgi:steroid 5-alpha reductase family enzyme